MGYFALQRKGHCQILLARIGFHNQLELEDQLKLGRVCQELNLSLNLWGGPGWQEKDPASLTSDL